MNFDFWNNKKIRYSIIAIILVVIAILTYVIRMLPSGVLTGSGDMIAGPDAWYNLRMVDVAMANGLGIISFEPFTLYPTGQNIVWGPLFTWVSTIFAMVAGAAARVDIINAVSVVPVILAVCMVPVMFFLGRKCGDWKTGIAAAVFIAIIGGQYLVRSVYGHFDHHIAETLFSTLFCMCYVWGIATLKNHAVDFKSAATLKLPIILGVITGIAYFLGLLTMTTIVVFGLMASVFTLIVFVINQKTGKPTEYLLVFNVVTFLIASIGLLIYGIRDTSFSMYSYSLGIFLSTMMIAVGTAVLYFIAYAIKKFEKPWYFYLGALVILVVIGILIAMFALPSAYNTAIGSLSQFFSNSDTASTIQEMASWTMDGALNSFTWAGILLSIGGLFVLLYEIWKGKREEAIFVLIWTLAMFIATTAHMRWEYYFAANVALLAAICVGKCLDMAKSDVLLLVNRNKPEPVTEQPKRSVGKKTKVTVQKKQANPIKIGVAGIVLVIGIVFICLAAPAAATTSQQLAYSTTPSPWIDATKWLKTNTPETGLDYLTLYKKEGFEYPEESYGVVSWWDYGHYITTIGERMPVANPFQAGVSGEYGVAKILVESNESVVTQKMDKLDSKYVMTDALMGDAIFPAITVWADTVKQYEPYYYTFFQSDQSGVLTPARIYSPGYFNTLTVRLQNYDGSYIPAGPVNVVYATKNSNYAYPIITNGQYYANAAEAKKVVDAYNSNSANTGAGKYAYLIPNGDTDSTKTYLLPPVDIPALKHFRMVYESAQSYVKTYEYVKGAVIKGDGTIQTTIKTNTGRSFVYRQQSENGQFIVPYATGANGAVTASQYTIAETGQTFTVSEEAVEKGLSIN